MRFYHVDPERVLQLPQYLVRILITNDIPLDAVEQQDRMLAAATPYLDDGERQRLVRQLAALARKLAPVAQAPAPAVLIVEEDPAKAAAWFAEHGAHLEETRGQANQTTEE